MQKSASFQRRSEARRDNTLQKKSTQLGMIDNLDLSLIDVQDMTVSRVAFWLCLVAAAGTAQLGRSAIPVVRWLTPIDVVERAVLVADQDILDSFRRLISPTMQDMG